MQSIISNKKPFNFTFPKKKGLRIRLYKFLNNKHYKNGILIVLILNFIILACHKEIQKEYYRKLIKISTSIIHFIYIIETIIKICCYNFKNYFLKDWHKIEFVIIIFIITHELAFILFSSFLSNFVILKLLKILPIIRLFDKVKIFENLLKNLTFSLLKIVNFLLLFIFVIIIYSIIGCYLFKNIQVGFAISPYVNFSNAINGIGILLKSCSADDWQYIMYDLSMFPPNCIPNYNCGSSNLIIINQFFKKNIL